MLEEHRAGRPGIYSPRRSQGQSGRPCLAVVRGQQDRVDQGDDEGEHAHGERERAGEHRAGEQQHAERVAVAGGHEDGAGGDEQAVGGESGGEGEPHHDALLVGWGVDAEGEQHEETSSTATAVMVGPTSGPAERSAITSRLVARLIMPNAATSRAAKSTVAKTATMVAYFW